MIDKDRLEETVNHNHHPITTSESFSSNDVELDLRRDMTVQSLLKKLSTNEIITFFKFVHRAISRIKEEYKNVGECRINLSKLNLEEIIVPNALGLNLTKLDEGKLEQLLNIDFTNGLYVFDSNPSHLRGFLRRRVHECSGNFAFRIQIDNNSGRGDLPMIIFSEEARIGFLNLLTRCSDPYIVLFCMRKSGIILHEFLIEANLNLRTELYDPNYGIRVNFSETYRTDMGESYFQTMDFLKKEMKALFTKKGGLFVINRALDHLRCKGQYDFSICERNRRGKILCETSLPRDIINIISRDKDCLKMRLYLKDSIVALNNHISQLVKRRDELTKVKSQRHRKKLKRLNYRMRERVDNTQNIGAINFKTDNVCLRDLREEIFKIHQIMAQEEKVVSRLQRRINRFITLRDDIRILLRLTFSVLHPASTGETVEEMINERNLI